MPSIDRVPLRIPAQWDPIWFDGLIRDWLRFADVRNARGEGGVTIGSDASGLGVISIDTPDAAPVFAPRFPQAEPANPYEVAAFLPRSQPAPVLGDAAVILQSRIFGGR